MSEDMSSLINQINNMIKNNQIPDDIKQMVNNMANNSSSSDQENEDISSNSSSNSNTQDIDMETILKMKKVMDSMKESKNDPRANLLKSLKPYLKDSRKAKIDQYIQLFGMGKVFEMLRTKFRW